jgi:hypothetical protein
VAVTCTDNGEPGSASATAYSTPWQQELSTAPAAVTFNKTSDVWTNYLNWTPNDVPLSGIVAKIGDPAVCSPATALLSGGDHAAKALYIATNDNGVATLNMTGGTLAVGSGSIKVADGASSTGTLNQTAGSITCAFLPPLAAGAGSVGSVTLGGASYIVGPFTVASGTNASGTLTLTGNATNHNGSGAYISPTVVGSGTKAIGRLNVSGTAIFDGAAPAVTALQLGVGSGSTGILVVAGQGAVSNVNLTVGLAGVGSVTLADTGRVFCTTLSIGDQSYGSFSMGGSSALRVSSVATLGNAAGAEGVMRVTGGSWTQSGALNIGTVAGATGRLTVADCALTGFAGATTVGGGVTAGDRLGSVTVSNATFGVGAGVTVVTNGFVELTGTGSVFQCSTFTCRGGTVTNRVSLFSGGVDVTSTATAALAVTNGGRMHLVFEAGPSVLGEYWGLRWAGNQKTRVDAIVADGALTWEDSAVGGGVKVFTNATHTMVGYVVDQMGTTFRFR